MPVTAEAGHQRCRVGRVVAQRPGTRRHRAGDFRPDVAGEQGPGRPDAGARRQGVRDGRRRLQRRRRDPGRHRRYRRRRARQRPGSASRPTWCWSTPASRRWSHAIEEGRQLWQRVQAAVSVLLGGNAGEVAVRHHRQRDHRDVAAEHPAAVAGEHDDRCAAGRRPCGQQAQRPGRARPAGPRSAGAVARRRHPRDDHRGGDDGGVGDGRRHRAARNAHPPWRWSRWWAPQLGQTLLDSHAPLVVIHRGGFAWA